MLGCYPIEATHENWLHESLVSMIQEVHVRLNVDTNIPSTQLCWKTLIPLGLSQEKNKILADASGVRDKFFAYKNSVSNLSPQQRQQIFSILENQNRIADLLVGSCNIETIEFDCPEVLMAVSNLFIFCFGKLTELKIRERQYQIIFTYLKTKICSFCGIERVMNPEETAQDQDHYFAKSTYPFAAANMRNLVPMCRCCNRDYKKTIDVIRDLNGNRRRAFDPYNCQPLTFSLLRSVIKADNSPPVPEWVIDFTPQSEEAETWDSVFQIRTRYKRDILNEYFGKWLGDFEKKCINDRKRLIIPKELSDLEVRTRLAYYCEDKGCSPSVGLASFLEPLVFELLLAQFDQGNQRIIQLIRDAVLGIKIEDAA